jgi:hypothetical protein
MLETAAPVAQVNIFTNRYDGPRTGANLAETALTAADVNVSRFGKLYTYPVDGAVYAQPLYVTDVVINGTPRNVLFVATMNDKIYAFDADSPSSSPLWMRDFTSPPSVTPVPITDIVGPNLNIVGNVGIQSTPVIDSASGTIYLVARTKENGSYVQRLHALDISTGASRAGSPVTISGSVAGTAPDSASGADGQVVTFNPKMQSQRAALAISNHVVLIAWAGHEDVTPFHGWVMGYDEASLARVGIFCVTPDVYAGGIWQGGRAPTIDDAGNAYFATGNGAWDGVRSFGDSLLKFSVSRTTGLTLIDYFTPGNQATLNAADDDLSGSGFTLLPTLPGTPVTHLLLGGGKEGVLYLLNADNLGRMTSGDTQIVQTIPETGGHIMGGAVFWNSASAGPLVYNWSEDDVLRSYRLSGGKLVVPAYLQGAVASPGHPGGSLTVSANGSAAGTGIVWASMPTSEDSIHGLHAAILRAFNADTLNEIWASEQNASRDRLGTLMKFVPPVVANGKVYIPNHDNAVAVYGLLPPGISGAIGIDFVGTNPTTMSPTESAGVVSKTNWNTAAGAASTAPLPLVDDSGAQTNATVTWSAPGGGWMTPITDQPGNVRMMKGYLDTSSSGLTTVSVAGLTPRGYDVYVYVDGDNKIYDRGAAYTISGAGITTTPVNLTDSANTSFISTFTRADNSNGNYVKFSINASGFTLEARPTTPEIGTRRAPVNGVQIVPTAPPPDFTIAATPASRTVTQGSSTTYTVSIGAVNGFAGTVSLAVAGAPAGTTTTFTPTSVTGSGSATLTVTTTSATAAASSTLTITGTSGPLRHSASVTLGVQAVTTNTSGTIGIDFVGTSPATMAPAESAGVVAKMNWNTAAGAASAASLSLVDDAGTRTNATASWSAPGGGWMTPIADAPGDARMMKGYLDTGSSSVTTVTVAGLAAAAYDVYVYVDGDNKIYDRGAAYTISGAGITTTTINVTDAANTNFASGFTRGDNSTGNYVRFSIAASGATGFTLEARPTTPETGTRRAPVNAIQIVPTSPPPPPAGFAIDFVGSATAMTAAESAGVVAKTNWNSAAGAASAAPLSLVDDSGAATTATVAWSANGAWMLPITDAAGNARMMKGYLDTNSASVTTVTVSGLSSRTYDVYVYADGDNRAYTRSAAYKVSGPGIADTTITLTDVADTNFAGTFTAASNSSGNYVKFTVTGSTFTLTATPGTATTATQRAPVNAIQIVPASR